MVCCWVRTRPDGNEGKRHLKVEASKAQVWFWDGIKRSHSGRLALLGSSTGVLRETCQEPAQLPSLPSAHIAAADDRVCPGCRHATGMNLADSLFFLAAIGNRSSFKKLVFIRL